MPNIDERYTLTEIAKELNVVPTFINRVQKLTHIGPSIGTKGKAASIEKKYVRIFRMVKALRMIGFSFEDIRKLWQHEEAILKIHSKLCEGSISRLFPLKHDVPGVQNIKLVIHKDSVYYLKTMDDLQVQDPYKQSYPELLEILRNMKQEMARKKGVFSEDIKKMIDELDFVLTDDNTKV